MGRGYHLEDIQKALCYPCSGVHSMLFPDEPEPIVVDHGVRPWLISCDESGFGGERYYGFGALWMPWDRRGDFLRDVQAIGAERGVAVGPGHEFKWNRVKSKKLGFYKAVVEYFFRRPYLLFHCIIVERAFVDRQRHDGGLDEARQKHFTLLLTNKIKRALNHERKRRFRVWVDPIPSRYRKAHEVGLKEAGVWSAVWVALSGLFALGVHQWFGADRALEFTTGYFIEKALAVDNIFVFVIVFAAFGIPAKYQHRVLVWGVLGALAMRAVFIVVGGALLQTFHWTTYVFGAVLLITGLKLLLQKEKPFLPGESLVVRAFQKVLPVTPELVGDRFTVVRAGRRWATPLLLALVSVEAADLVFAVDSIPAVFAVTTDPFIVFTSNIFAILGLRSMYFLLAGIITRFTHLKTGLAVVLILDIFV